MTSSANDDAIGKLGQAAFSAILKSAEGMERGPKGGVLIPASEVTVVYGPIRWRLTMGAIEELPQDRRMNEGHPINPKETEG